MSILWESLLSNAAVATLLAVVIIVVGYFRPAPVVLHALWLIVLLKLVTPPLMRIEIPTAMPGSPPYLHEGLAAETPHGEPNERMVSDRPAALSSPPPPGRTASLPPGPPLNPGPTSGGMWNKIVAGSPTLLGALWAAGSATWFILACCRLLRFHRHLRHARPADESLQRIAADVARQLRVRACPQVRVTDAALPPMLVSRLGSSVIVLPSELLRGLSPAQQASILGHELAHYRRGDHWSRWLELIVLGLYWWLPTSWLACRRLRQAEELCCDAWVLRVFPDQAKGYAQALLATVDFLSAVRAPAPLGASGLGQAHSLQRRLEMILKRTGRAELSSAARLTVVALALGVLPWAPRAFSQAATEPPSVKPAPISEPQAQPLGLPASQTVAPPTASNTEERLARLEAMLQKLLDAQQADRAQAPPASDAKQFIGQAQQEIAKLSAQIQGLEAQLAALRDQRTRVQEKLWKMFPDAADPKILLPQSLPTAPTLEPDVLLPSNNAGQADAIRLPVLRDIPLVGRLFTGEDGKVSYTIDPQGRKLTAADVQSGKLLWTLELGDLRRVDALRLDDGRLIVADKGEREIVVDAATGKILSESKAPIDPAAGPRK